jgi:L-lactate dehydrogenase complex protein LldG
MSETMEMIDRFVDGLRANACDVVGPFAEADATAAIAGSVSRLVACNRDVSLPALPAALVAAGIEVLDGNDPAFSTRVEGAAAGITGSRLAVVEPATIALVAAPGSPRATSLIPPAHVCVVRLVDVVATLDAAIATLAAEPLPSAVSWIGGPSRTGDLEMILTLGVHGPRNVTVVLVADG